MVKPENNFSTEFRMMVMMPPHFTANVMGKEKLLLSSNVQQETFLEDLLLPPGTLLTGLELLARFSSPYEILTMILQLNFLSKHTKSSLDMLCVEVLRTVQSLVEAVILAFTITVLLIITVSLVFLTLMQTVEQNAVRKHSQEHGISLFQI